MLDPVLTDNRFLSVCALQGLPFVLDHIHGKVMESHVFAQKPANVYELNFDILVDELWILLITEGLSRSQALCRINLNLIWSQSR